MTHWAGQRSASRPWRWSCAATYVESSVVSMAEGLSPGCEGAHENEGRSSSKTFALETYPFEPYASFISIHATSMDGAMNALHSSCRLKNTCLSWRVGVGSLQDVVKLRGKRLREATHQPHQSAD